MTEFVTIASGTLVARINPLGAELWSLTDLQGREYMTNADPAFWTGRAPILFPIVGMVNKGRYRLGDQTYELPKHGFARHSRFEIIEVAADKAILRLRDSIETRAVYPFAFTLDLQFQIRGATLEVEARVTNCDAGPMPFSFGFHPAFAWPLPGNCAKEDHKITFSLPEPQPIRRIDPNSGLVLPGHFPTPVVGYELVPEASQFEADAMIWNAISSRSLTFGGQKGATVQVAFPGMPMLGIWQKPGAAYLCIEPWQGVADAIGFDGDFREKPGVISLAGGKTHRLRMDVTITPEDAG